MRTILFLVGLFLLTACQVPEEELETAEYDPNGRGGVPNREWVPGCDSNGKSDEHNPHCIDVERIKMISDDARLRNLHSIATDGEYLYVGGSDEFRRAIVWRVSLESFEVIEITSQWWSTSSGGWAFAIEVVGDELFLVDPNAGPFTDTQVLRGPKNGLGTFTPIYTESKTARADYDIYDGSGLATDGTRLYITDHVQGRVSRMNTDGSAPKYLGGGRYGGFFDVEHRNTVAYYDSALYIADSADRGNCNCGNFTPKILSLPSDGGSFTTLHEGAPLVHPYDIDVHPASDRLVVVDFAAGNSIFVMPRAGGVPTAIVSGDPFIKLMGVVVLENDAYVIDTGDGITGGRIFKVPLAQNY